MSLDILYRTDLAFKSDYIVTDTGDLAALSGLENLKDALMHRLITQPGSLVHRPNYGVGIKSYLNAPSSIGVQRNLAMLIAEQFAQDPRVDTVTGVQIIPDEQNSEQFVMNVKVKALGYGETEFRFIPFGEF